MYAEGSVRSLDSEASTNDGLIISKTPSTDESQDPQDSPKVVSSGIEAELAHHYLSHTWKTFAAALPEPSPYNVWGVEIPAIAYTCGAVRNGMLALAALCLHFDSPTDSDKAAEYLEAAKFHGPICLKAHSAQIRGTGAPNMDSVLACSRLLCTIALAFFRTHRRSGVTLADPESWTWMQLMRGVQTVQSAFLESGHSMDLLLRHQLIPEIPVPYSKNFRTEFADEKSHALCPV